MKRLLVSFLVISLIVGSTSCQSQTQKIQLAEKLIQKVKEDNQTVGLAVTVVKDGEIVWSKGFGMESLEHETPVDASKTKFRIASISKAMTSAALGVLMENGELDVDLPVQNYVPYYPKGKYEVTTRQVAGHIAGIRHYRGNEFLSTKRYYSVKDGLRIFMNDSLLFEPGTNYSYSSYGYNLVSAVIEGASGVDFLTYMRDGVFIPLGMKSTVPDYHDSIIMHRTDFYGMDQGKIVHAPYVDNSYKWAGGGFLSTTEDLARFGMGILSNSLFSEQVLKELITPQRLKNGYQTVYGMGWFVGENEHGRKYFGHGGGAVGGSGSFMIFPDENLVVAIYTNDTRANVRSAIHNLAELFMK